MDDDNADHPAPIIQPLHSSNDEKTDPADYTPISISTTVSARQVKVIDDSGGCDFFSTPPQKSSLSRRFRHTTTATAAKYS